MTESTLTMMPEPKLLPVPDDILRTHFRDDPILIMISPKLIIAESILEIMHWGTGKLIATYSEDLKSCGLEADEKAFACRNSSILPLSGYIYPLSSTFNT